MVDASFIKAFETAFGSKPDITCFSPGRVNLIGEHVDHQGYSVLPTALRLYITFGVCRKPFNGNLLEIQSPDPKFTTRQIKNLEDVKMVAGGHWTNYVLAALFGICEYGESKGDLSQVGSPNTLVKGLVENKFAKEKLDGKHSYQIFIDGQVPVAAGVSSSAALVVASASTFMHLFDLKLTRLQLADMCAVAERHTGVASGGMDQASICLSKPGGAQLISFSPLRADTVYLPKCAALVVTNTCRSSPKHETAAIYYNKRVFELMVACYMILRGEFPDEKITPEMIPTYTLKAVQEKCKVPLEEAHKLVEKHIPNRAISRRGMIKLIGAEGVEAISKSKVGPHVWKRNTFFDPYRRAYHVFTEANRVFEFVRVCADTTKDDETKMKLLGDLMNGSDESLAADFDCSCPELYDVNSLAMRLGAYGSRLTGAGWGGCAVSLVHMDKLQTFMEGMRAYFNKEEHPECNFPENLSKVLFSVIPGPGATLYDSNLAVVAWE